MKYWMKVFPSGGELYGSEIEEEAGLVSWSRTPCVLKECVLQDGEEILHLKGEGAYWQSDRYEAVVAPGEVKPTKVKRRIMRQVQPGEDFAFANRDNHYLTVDFTTKDPCTLSMPDPGSWIVLEIDLCTRKLDYYYSRERV